jgi:hypothetical protein
MPGRPQALYGIAVLTCLINLAALVLLRTLLRRLGVTLWPLAVLIYAPFCFLSQLGTEGALSGLLLAALMLTLWQAAQDRQSSLRRLMLANVVAGLAVLARLDNIFIVTLVWAAAWIALGRSRGARLRFTLCGLLPAAAWAFYIFTNHHYFGTIEPISGLLKSTSDLHHSFGENLPHTGELSLLLIVLCLPVLAWRQRDLFFKVVELPFALGVFCHAYYILFRMSTETHWSWYYTSWVLLAAVLLARVAMLLMRHRPSLMLATQWVAVLLLAVVWTRMDLFGNIPLQLDEGYRTFQHDAYEVRGVRRLIAYDGPGRLAYFSDVQIVPLDGLMGNLAFQREIGSKGIMEFVRENHIDSFAGPPIPFDLGAERGRCGVISLGSTRPTCMQTGPDQWTVISEEVYARYPAHDAGAVPLKPENIVWTAPNYMTVWKLGPQP